MDKKECIDQTELFVLDMDGTVYLGNRLIKGAKECIEKIREKKDFVFFTNNSSKSPQLYIEKLNNLGLSCTRKQIMTSGDVTIHYVLKNYPGKNVYLLGTPSLEESFIDAGVPLFNPQNEDPCIGELPDLVVVGFDKTVTFEKMDRAAAYIRRGATFLATHLDINCPTENGFMIDCGSLCKAIACSSGVEPKYLGKPFTETLQYVLDETGIIKEHITFVGDRLYTDVATGVENGAKGVLVLTGEATLADVETGNVKPSAVFQSLEEIGEFI